MRIPAHDRAYAVLVQGSRGKCVPEREIMPGADLMGADDGFCSIPRYLPCTGSHNQREELPDIIRGNGRCSLLPYDNRERTAELLQKTYKNIPAMVVR